MFKGTVLAKNMYLTALFNLRRNRIYFRRGMQRKRLSKRKAAKKELMESQKTEEGQF